MMQPRLAICIPTHHGRAPFLNEALNSVLVQLGDVPPNSVTICISDNASEDGTQALVKDLIPQYPGLISYHRHDANLGFLPNMMQVMQEALGEYGWLLSSDDRIAPGGLRRIWEALGSTPDLAGLTMNFQAYDATMTCRLDTLPLRLYPAGRQESHLYLSLEDAFRQCGSLAGYISGQVYHRGLWREAAESLGLERIEAAGYFPYVLVLGEMLKRRPRWLWVPEPSVENRMGNDSVTPGLNRNILRYQYNVLHDMTQIWATLLGARSQAFRALVRDNHASLWSWRAVCSYKINSNCTFNDEFRVLIEFTRRLYFLPSFWLFVFPILLLPHQVLRAVLFPAIRLRRRLNTTRPSAAEAG